MTLGQGKADDRLNQLRGRPPLLYFYMTLGQGKADDRLNQLCDRLYYNFIWLWDKVKQMIGSTNYVTAFIITLFDPGTR